MEGTASRNSLADSQKSYKSRRELLMSNDPSSRALGTRHGKESPANGTRSRTMKPKETHSYRGGHLSNSVKFKEGASQNGS